MTKPDIRPRHFTDEDTGELARYVAEERVTEDEFHAVTTIFKIHEEGNEVHDILGKIEQRNDALEAVVAALEARRV